MKKDKEEDEEGALADASGLLIPNSVIFSIKSV